MIISLHVTVIFLQHMFEVMCAYSGNNHMSAISKKIQSTEDNNLVRSFVVWGWGGPICRTIAMNALDVKA